MVLLHSYHCKNRKVTLTWVTLVVSVSYVTMQPRNAQLYITGFLEASPAVSSLVGPFRRLILLRSLHLSACNQDELPGPDVQDWQSHTNCFQ